MALLKGLQAYYRYDENAGTSVGDATKRGNTGTWQGGVGSQWTTGIINSGGNFDGSTNAVQVNDSYSLDFMTNAMSISAWIYPSTASVQFGTIVKKLNQYIFRLGGSQLTFYTTTGSQVLLAGPASGYAANTWNHVVATYDASVNPSLNLYRNGVNVANANNQSGNMAVSTNPLAMGGTAGGGGENFIGRIDEVGIWNRGLSAAEVTTLYNSGNGLSYPFGELPPTFFVAPTADFISTTLKGQISSGSTYIALATIANIQTPGYIVIDRTNTATPPSSTPSIREVISFTSISSISILTGITRGADSSPTVGHLDGALIESVWTTGMWNSLTTIIQTAFDSQGLLLPLNNLISIQGISANTIYTSVASIGIANIITQLDVSSASVTGFGMTPIFTGSGSYSGPTTAIGGLYIAPRAGTLKWVSAITRYVASGSSVGFDFQVRNTSIFANATTRPAIPAGGTFVSTASIATLNINSGDILQANVDSLLPGAGLIREVTVSGGVN